MDQVSDLRSLISSVEAKWRATSSCSRPREPSPRARTNSSRCSCCSPTTAIRRLRRRPKPPSRRLPRGPLTGFLAQIGRDERDAGVFRRRAAFSRRRWRRSTPSEPLVDTSTESATGARRTSRNRRSRDCCRRCPVIERMKLAMKGTREQRAVLVRDSNRLVASAVLSSPKLTESEVEAFTKMGNVSEDVLRVIGTNRSWLKNYAVVRGLCRNPKTPPAIAMQLIHRLNERDLKVALDRSEHLGSVARARAQDPDEGEVRLAVRRAFRSARLRPIPSAAPPALPCTRPPCCGPSSVFNDLSRSIARSKSR